MSVDPASVARRRPPRRRSRWPRVAALVVGAAALVVFVLRQLSRQGDGRALLDLRPFTTPAFSLGLGMLAISMMSLFGALILLPLYLQNVRGLDTLTTGLLLLPGGPLNADSLRLTVDAQKIAKSFVSSGRPVASICHGLGIDLQTEIESKLEKNKGRGLHHGGKAV